MRCAAVVLWPGRPSAPPLFIAYHPSTFLLPKLPFLILRPPSPSVSALKKKEKKRGEGEEWSDSNQSPPSSLIALAFLFRKGPERV